MEFSILGVDSSGEVVRSIDPALMRRFAEVHPFMQMCAIQFSVVQDLAGRIFLLEPHFISNVEDELRFLQDLVRHVSPAVYNLYLVRKLRKRAGALERARLVRELHDGAVQSLIGVEMQMDVLRRTYPIATPLGLELERIQQLLREEVLKLRELMQEMKSADIDARKL